MSSLHRFYSYRLKLLLTWDYMLHNGGHQSHYPCQLSEYLDGRVGITCHANADSPVTILANSINTSKGVLRLHAA